MEIPDKYVLMCKKAVEVQEKWKPEFLDICVDLKDGGYGPILYHDENHKEGFVWLPRQEDLQDLLPISEIYTNAHPGTSRIDFLACCFESGVFTLTTLGPGGIILPFDSMEQFWLAIVMYELYQKRWDDTEENWVVE